jgi:putative transcription regulator (winged helix DNA-binding domain)
VALIGETGPKGDAGASAYVNVNHESGIINIGVNDGVSESISFTELKGDKGDTGAKGEAGARGDTGSQGAKGDKGDTGATGATGPATDENAGWKLPVDKILTTTTLPTGVGKGYRVTIVTSSVMAIKEYNGSSWETVLIPSQITKNSGIRTNHISKVLSELKSHELVECINPEVRKGRLYRLTDKGEKVAENIEFNE